jgi:hypothetical protein
MVPAGLAARVLSAAGLAAALGCLGCSGTADPVVTRIPKAEQDLCSIAQAYREAFEQRKKAPESFEDLRQYLSGLGNPDEMKVSPNDNEPYVVMWGCDPTKGGAGPVKGMWAIIAHEKTGKGGTKAVADIRGLATTVTDEEFAKLKFITPGKKKAGGG